MNTLFLIPLGDLALCTLLHWLWLRKPGDGFWGWLGNVLGLHLAVLSLPLPGLFSPKTIVWIWATAIFVLPLLVGYFIFPEVYTRASPIDAGIGILALYISVFILFTAFRVLRFLVRVLAAAHRSGALADASNTILSGLVSVISLALIGAAIGLFFDRDKET